MISHVQFLMPNLAVDSSFDCSDRSAKEVLKVLQSSLLQANT